MAFDGRFRGEETISPPPGLEHLAPEKAGFPKFVMPYPEIALQNAQVLQLAVNLAQQRITEAAQQAQALRVLQHAQALGLAALPELYISAVRGLAKVREQWLLEQAVTLTANFAGDFKSPPPGMAVFAGPDLQAEAELEAEAARCKQAKIPIVHSLASCVKVLSNENPDQLLVLRRISQLGFKAHHILKSHFSSRGKVIRILLVHSTMSQLRGDRCRPSSLGFVHMASAEAAAQILKEGEVMVNGVLIRVTKFERRTEQEAYEQ